MLGLIFTTLMVTLVASQHRSRKILCQTQGGKLEESFIGDVMRVVNQRVRAETMLGRIANARTQTMLPPARFMNELGWDCDLEKEAIQALGDACTVNKPVTPEGSTGLYYRVNDPEISHLIEAVDVWQEQIAQFLLPYQHIDKISQVVKYPPTPHLNNYLNLVRASTTKIGCAQSICVNNGERIYRAFCLTNKPPLKKGEVVYNIGRGGCNKGDTCPTGSSCNRATGLCKED